MFYYPPKSSQPAKKFFVTDTPTLRYPGSTLYAHTLRRSNNCGFAALCLMLLGLTCAGPWVLADTFPPGPADDSTPSMGVFRLVVAPAFRGLVAPAVGFNGYPGYSS